jgi:hypothetical protein
MYLGRKKSFSPQHQLIGALLQLKVANGHFKKSSKLYNKPKINVDHILGQIFA